MHLFRFKKRSTDHLVRFTEQVMRGRSPLSQGLRELIGAFLSSRNQCGFCQCAHAPVAARLLGRELVDEVLADPETSRLDAAHKELFRYVAKLADNPALVTAADISRLKEAGWNEEAIYDTLTVVSLFKFYNTWNNGSGVQMMAAQDYAHSGDRLIQLGYCMDFGFVGAVKMMWKSRREVRFSDFVELTKAWLGIRGAESTGPVASAAEDSVNGANAVNGNACAAGRLSARGPVRVRPGKVPVAT
jgi:uncharacterized peroxidase-related enzyme